MLGHGRPQKTNLLFKLFYYPLFNRDSWKQNVRADRQTDRQTGMPSQYFAKYKKLKLKYSSKDTVHGDS